VSRDRGEHDEMTAMLCRESSCPAAGSCAFIPPNRQAQPFRAPICRIKAIPNANGTGMLDVSSGSVFASTLGNMGE
jgi:hypothetical protein